MLEGIDSNMIIQAVKNMPQIPGRFEVIKRENINQQGKITVEKFQG